LRFQDQSVGEISSDLAGHVGEGFEGDTVLGILDRLKHFWIKGVAIDESFDLVSLGPRSLGSLSDRVRESGVGD
jgi:hypothetical protein